MRYPIKTPSQLPLVLKGFRKARGFTQAAMAQRLGITQQSYAYFEANPATATLERLFLVLRILGAEIALDQLDTTTRAQPKVSTSATASAKAVGRSVSGNGSAIATGGKTIRTGIANNGNLAPRRATPARVRTAAHKKESW